MPETREAFLDRLDRLIGEGETEIRFGNGHHTHAVCREGDGWSVRRLELDEADARIYLEQHGMFIPEHAEMLSRPGVRVLVAPSLPVLFESLAEAPWPFSH